VNRRKAFIISCLTPFCLLLPSVPLLAVPVRIAVISGEGERAPKAGVAELLTVELSRQDGVVVLERDEVWRVLSEHKLQAANLTCGAGAIQAGAILKADALVFVDRIGGSNSPRHRLQFLETPTGVILDSIFFEAENIEKSTAALLPTFGHALRWLRLPQPEKRYVGLLGYTAEQQKTNTEDLADALPALLAHELERSPNVLVVDREHLSSLQQEKELSGVQLRLALSTFLIEGEIRPTPGTPDTLDINTVIRPLAGANPPPPLIRMTTPRRDLPGFPPLLAARVLESIHAHPTVVTNADPAVEGEWFRQRAGHLQQYGETEKALAAAEAAYVLNPSPANASQLAPLVKASAYGKLGSGEPQKQAALRDLIRAVHLWQMLMDDRNAHTNVVTKYPEDRLNHKLLELSEKWQELRSDDGETRALYHELLVAVRHAEDTEVEFCRHLWPSAPYGRRHPPALGFTGKSYSYEDRGSTRYYASLSHYAFNERLSRAESAEDFVADAEHYLGGFLGMPGYTPPDVVWIVLYAPYCGQFWNDLNRRFPEEREKRKLLEWAEWTCRLESPHARVAGLYYDAELSKSLAPERSVRRARQMVDASRGLVRQYGDLPGLEGLVRSCVQCLPPAESKQVWDEVMYQSALDNLDARSFVDWCDYGLHIYPHVSGERTYEFLSRDEAFKLRWLDAAIKKLPPLDLARYRRTDDQDAINDVYNTLTGLRMMVRDHVKEPPPPEVSRYWDSYRVEEIQSPPHAAGARLDVFKRQDDQILAVWSEPGKPGARVLHSQVLDLDGRVAREFPLFDDTRPFQPPADPPKVADAACWLNRLYASAPGCGLIAFDASGATSIGKAQGLPGDDTSAIAVCGDTLLVGFATDYLGTLNLPDHIWHEIAYSRSLLKRNPLDGCSSRFRVIDALALPDRTAWILTEDPWALWKFDLRDGTLTNTAAASGCSHLAMDDGRLLCFPSAFVQEINPRTGKLLNVSVCGDTIHFTAPHLLMERDVISAGKGVTSGTVSSSGRSYAIGQGGLYLHKKELNRIFHLPLYSGGKQVQVDYAVRTSHDNAILAARSGLFWRLTDLHRIVSEEREASEAARMQEAFARTQTNRIPAAGVTSSSYAVVGTNAYPPALIQDGNACTCWASATNDVLGAWVEFDFGKPVRLTSVRIVNGWIDSESNPSLYPINHRARRLRCTDDSGNDIILDVADNHDPQFLPLPLVRPVRTLRFTVREIYRAEVESQDDPPWVTISEMTFFGNPAP